MLIFGAFKSFPWQQEDFNVSLKNSTQSLWRARSFSKFNSKLVTSTKLYKVQLKAFDTFGAFQQTLKSFSKLCCSLISEKTSNYVAILLKLPIVPLLAVLLVLICIKFSRNLICSLNFYPKSTIRKSFWWLFSILYFTTLKTRGK